MRGHSTYLAIGRICLKHSMHNVSAIPVATGTTKQVVVDGTPKEKRQYKTNISL